MFIDRNDLLEKQYEHLMKKSEAHYYIVQVIQYAHHTCH